MEQSVLGASYSYAGYKNFVSSFAVLRPGGHLNIKTPLYQCMDPYDKMRRSHDRFIFIMEIPIPGKTVFINILRHVKII